MYLYIQIPILFQSNYRLEFNFINHTIVAFNCYNYIFILPFKTLKNIDLKFLCVEFCVVEFGDVEFGDVEFCVCGILCVWNFVLWNLAMWNFACVEFGSYTGPNRSIPCSCPIVKLVPFL